MMREVRADIFDVMPTDKIQVVKFVPTNGEGVMGEGLAKQCRERYAFMEDALKLQLALYGNRPNFLGTYDGVPWFSFPTKEEQEKDSSKVLITYSCLCVKSYLSILSRWEREHRFLIPRVGGNLDWEKDVRPILNVYFENEERVLIVDLKE